MPTPPDFTAGTSLAAASLNKVGLWLVKTQTIGSGVTSVTVSSAFSADYENYLIVISGGTLSLDTHTRLSLGSANTNYYGNLIYSSYNSTAVQGATDNNQAYWSWGGSSGGANSGYILLMNPYRTEYTEVTARMRYSIVYGTYTGLHNAQTSFTSFTITAAAGTMTGGTIRVYGYRL